jgi:hypothetical protein
LLYIKFFKILIAEQLRAQFSTTDTGNHGLGTGSWHGVPYSYSIFLELYIGNLCNKVLTSICILNARHYGAIWGWEQDRDKLLCVINCKIENEHISIKQMLNFKSINSVLYWFFWYSEPENNKYILLILVPFLPNNEWNPRNWHLNWP